MINSDKSIDRVIILIMCSAVLESKCMRKLLFSALFWTMFVNKSRNEKNQKTHNMIQFGNNVSLIDQMQ